MPGVLQYCPNKQIAPLLYEPVNISDDKYYENLDRYSCIWRSKKEKKGKMPLGTGRAPAMCVSFYLSQHQKLTLHFLQLLQQAVRYWAET